MRRCCSFLVALLLLVHAAHAANELFYSSSGCNEYITERDDSDYANKGVQWRVFYKCCGQSCFTPTPWTNQDGPMNLCGSTIPAPGTGSGQARYNSQGDVLLDVPLGRGGVLSYVPSASCYPFTSDGGSVLVIPHALLYASPL